MSRLYKSRWARDTAVVFFRNIVSIKTEREEQGSGIRDHRHPSPLPKRLTCVFCIYLNLISYVDHFHLKTKCCHASLTLSLDEWGNIQLMMGSSIHTVT